MVSALMKIGGFTKALADRLNFPVIVTRRLRLTSPMTGSARHSSQPPPELHIGERRNEIEVPRRPHHGPPRWLTRRSPKRETTTSQEKAGGRLLGKSGEAAA